MKDREETEECKVTLSGLLNFIDGLCSACGGKRLIVLATNYVEKLYPALVRRGRVDKHIELPYCCFEAFKVLARNYLDVESHATFPTIGRLLEETSMTPADVAENLMPKTAEMDADTSLENLITPLEKAKEEARLKPEGEERLKAEKEEQEKEEIPKAEKEGKEKEKEERRPVDGVVKENGS